MKAQIQVRVDAKQKKQAQKILNKLGMDLSTAIRMFIVQVNRAKTFPPELRDENGFRPHKAKEMEESIKDARNSKGYTSVKELMKDLMA